MVTTTDIGTRCACCGAPLAETEAVVHCPVCGKAYHSACRQQDGCLNGTCAGPPLLIESEGAEERLVLRPETPLRHALPWLIGAGVVLLLVLTGTIAHLAFAVSYKTILIVSVVIAALTFDYVNGMHDAGNAIATVISTRVLTPVAALVMAAILNLVGALWHGGVASSIATKFADMHRIEPGQITMVMILCGLIGASAWSYLTASWGLPVSTSHSLFGGLIGVFLLGGIPLNMEYLGKLGFFMVVAPLAAFSIGWLLMVALMWSFRSVAPYKLNKQFRVLQVFSSAFMAFMHGSNDAQKAMGIITMALVAGEFLAVPAHGDVGVPLWVKISCALVIALGTGLGGMRVIKTLGHKIIKLAPVHGFTAETVAATTIGIVTALHVPISTTHVISSSILGIGASKRLSAVRWGVASNIVIAWVFTIPTCAMAGALLYWVVKWFGLK